MSDASQNVPEAPGAIASQLANAIEKMLAEWPTEQTAAKVTLHLTFAQWDELLSTLRPENAAGVEQIFDPST